MTLTFIHKIKSYFPTYGFQNFIFDPIPDAFVLSTRASSLLLLDISDKVRVSLHQLPGLLLLTLVQSRQHVDIMQLL